MFGRVFLYSSLSPFWFCSHLTEIEKASCFTLIVFFSFMCFFFLCSGVLTLNLVVTPLNTITNSANLDQAALVRAA